MERFKEATKGQTTTDICVLFSFWQANFSNGSNLKTLADERNMSLNYASKSFNNKSILPYDRHRSIISNDATGTAKEHAGDEEVSDLRPFSDRGKSAD